MKLFTVRSAYHSMARKPVSYYRNRSGFTLIEALIAVTVTLIMMLALSKGFVMMSQSISEGRSKLNLSDQLRGISMTMREDLSGMTAAGDPKLSANQDGYFEILEGPLSDSTAALANFDSTQTSLEQKNPASRYGDFDDILAFTAKAKKGQWFYGEIPYPMVMGPAQKALVDSGGGSPTDNYPNYVAEDWARTVTVASDTAEIVYFMMPYGADPAQFPFDTGASPLPAVNFSSAVAADLTPNFALSNTAAGVPARMVLCRRVLLVLPSLNVPAGTNLPGMPTSPTLVTTREPMLFYNSTSSLNPQTQLHVPALGNVGSPNVDTYRVGMQIPYQRCDLSVRRVPDENTSNTLTTYDPIAANSLADLQDPKNRFAHTVLPIAATNNTTMPVWSLTGPAALQVAALTGLVNAVTGASTLQDGNFSHSVASTTQQPELGFIYPHFLRQRRTDPATAAVKSEAEITYEVAFSEVVATNCIAFDVKGYDPQLTQWYHPGVDGLPLAANANILGTSGSDDIVVRPSDPGYSDALSIWCSAYWNNSNGTWNNSPSGLIARTGGFTDIGWRFTLRNSALIEKAKKAAGVFTLSTTTNWVDDTTTNAMPQLSSALSLTYPITPSTTFVGPVPFTADAFKSGKVLMTSNGLLQIYQPGFDTFTNRYEVDGYKQTNNPDTLANGGNGGYYGNVWIDGQYQYGFPTGTVPYVPTSANNPPLLPAQQGDLGTNGVDDSAYDLQAGMITTGGIDDVSERDAVPPISTPLKAVQVTIRLEDKGANVIQQVVVDHELRMEN